MRTPARLEGQLQRRAMICTLDHPCACARGRGRGHLSGRDGIAPAHGARLRMHLQWSTLFRLSVDCLVFERPLPRRPRSKPSGLRRNTQASKWCRHSHQPASRNRAFPVTCARPACACPPHPPPPCPDCAPLLSQVTPASQDRQYSCLRIHVDGVRRRSGGRAIAQCTTSHAAARRPASRFANYAFSVHRAGVTSVNATSRVFYKWQYRPHAHY